MKRSLTLLGAAVITVVGAVAASQAQSPQNPQAPGEQRGGRPEIGQGIGAGAHPFECGPPREGDGPGRGLRPGRGGEPGQPGVMRGRGPGAGRPGAVGPGGPGGPGRGGRGNPLCALDLTEEQKSQIAAIHQKAQQDVEAVLTPEQREKLHARRGRQH